MRAISLWALLVLCAVSSATATQKPSLGGCLQHGKLDEEHRFSDFVIRVYRARNDAYGCLQVLRNNQTVFFRLAEGKFLSSASGAVVRIAVLLSWNLGTIRERSLLSTQKIRITLILRT